MRSMFRSVSDQGGMETRTRRHSSGWAELLKHLQTAEGLRILDVGATSPSNINFLTGLGHSVYMANFVEEAARPEWRVQVKRDPADPGAPQTRFNADGFVKADLEFSGRQFDVIALWDVVDYLPVELVDPMVERLKQVLVPGGKLLAFFHTKLGAQDQTFARYHLTDGSQVELQRIGIHPIVQTFQNRQIERLFKGFSSYRFFLAKDSLQEVIATR